MGFIIGDTQVWYTLGTVYYLNDDENRMGSAVLLPLPSWPSALEYFLLSCSEFSVVIMMSTNHIALIIVSLTLSKKRCMFCICLSHTTHHTFYACGKSTCYLKSHIGVTLWRCRLVQFKQRVLTGTMPAWCLWELTSQWILSLWRVASQTLVIPERAGRLFFFF